MKKIKSILAPLYLTAALFGSAMFFHAVYKLGDFEKLHRKYVPAVEEKDYGMCSPAASELEQWCQENYFSAKGLALRVMDETSTIEYPKIKYACETARHNKVFYQYHIQRFLHQLDQDASLRQELEEKIYGSEVETGIDIQRSEERYTFSFREDKSDALYHHLFTVLRDDKRSQELFLEIIRGNISAVDQYKELVKEIIKREQPSSDLEERVRRDILEGFDSGDTYKLLVAMAETGLARTKLKESYSRDIAQFTHFISLEQELKKKYEQTPTLLEEVEQELQHIDKELTNYTKQLEEARQNEQRVAQEQEESFQKYTDSFWRALTVDLVNSSILYSRDGRKIMNSGIIAGGHTHPYTLASKASNAGPSPEDQKIGFRKPELVFEGLKDTWCVYSALCGQVTLEREYPRTINPPSAPDTFLNPHLK